MTNHEAIVRFPWRQERPEKQTGMRLALAAMVATTRREWSSPLTADSGAGDAMIMQARSAHPLTRFSLDAKRHIAWRERIGRQEWVQSVVQFAKLNRTPERAS